MLTFFHLVLLKKMCLASLKAHWKSGRKNCARKRRFNSYCKKIQFNWTNKFTKYIRNTRWNFIRIHRKTQKKMHLKDILTRYERSQAVALNAIVRLLADIIISAACSSYKSCVRRMHWPEATSWEYRLWTYSLRQLTQALDIASVFVQQNQPAAPWNNLMNKRVKFI